MPIQSWLAAMCAQAALAEQRLSRVNERYSGYAVYLSGMLIFVASRVVVAIGLYFAKHVKPFFGDRVPMNADDAWYHGLLRWDSGWYMVMHDCYRYSGDPAVQGSTGFYPLYPLISSVVKMAFGINEGQALLLVASVASVVAAILLIKFIKDEVGDEIALWSVAFFWFWRRQPRAMQF
jgi:Gpi18-like mannosyltransferase